MTSVTVLIPTVRPRSLLRLLGALADQADPGVAWEVLVVDNGSTPAAESVLGSTSLATPVRVVREPEPGASAARNRGVAEIASPITVLLDDDVVPERGWLRELVGTLNDGGYDAAGGKVVLDPEVTLPRWLDHSLAGFVTALDLGPEPRALDRSEYVLTANAAFRTDLLRELGFDPRLGPRPGAHLTNDDLDLVRRAFDAGATIGWVPAAVVVHDAPPERLRLRWIARRAYEQGRSDRLLHREEAASARLGGIRAGWWHLRDRTRWWYAHRQSIATLSAHLLVEFARTLGWWRECIRERVAR